ncbi:uncharacterized protein JCM15063_003424 [Sporobolomyces koalae]|uniref:uncharacterized protein n=1 Tax=Sporobolomyces koalae TaxID=500713 RepID=UPI0031789BDE
MHPNLLPSTPSTAVERSTRIRQSPQSPVSNATPLHSPSSYASSASPATPATPFTDSLALRSRDLSSAREPYSADLGRSKLLGREGVSKARGDDTGGDTDDDFEDELNDFGYGPVTRKHRPKESLLDMLNSEPPSWLVETEPVPVSIPVKSTTMPGKLLKKFSSSTTDPSISAGFSTLSRGGSGASRQDQSVLRSSRSASNLLSNIRSKTSHFTLRKSSGNTRSREDLQGSVDLTARSMDSKARPTVSQEDDFESLINSNVPPPTRRLTPQGALAKPPGTRELASYLSSSQSPFDKSNSTLSLADTVASSGASGSLHTQSSASIDGASSGQSIVKAAMVRLGARRASLGPSNNTHTLPKRPQTSSGIPRFNVSRKLQRPSTAQTLASEDSVYDPQNKETIQVDESLVRGMFGSSSRTAAAQEPPRSSSDEAKLAPALGVYEFVEIDQRESGGRSPELHRLGSLTRMRSLINIAEDCSALVLTKRLPSRTPSRIATPARRKPTPLVSAARDNATQPPSPVSLPQPRSSPTSPTFVDSQISSDPLRTTVNAVNAVTRHSSFPFSSLLPAGDSSTTPTTPYELYSTPPLTPAEPAARSSPSDTELEVLTTYSSTQARQAPRDDARIPSQLQERVSTDSGQPPTPVGAGSPSSLRKDSFQPRPFTLKPIGPLSPGPTSIAATPSELVSLMPNQAARPIDADDAIRTALGTLRESLFETANLSVVSTSPNDLVPTLKGMQLNMLYCAQLIGAIVARAKQEGSEQTQDEIREEGTMVEALLSEA